jgi:hypothetical protein
MPAHRGPEEDRRVPLRDRLPLVVVAACERVVPDALQSAFRPAKAALLMRIVERALVLPTWARMSQAGAWALFVEYVNDAVFDLPEERRVFVEDVVLLFNLVTTIPGGMPSPRGHRGRGSSRGSS